MTFSVDAGVSLGSEIVYQRKTVCGTSGSIGPIETFSPWSQSFSGADDCMVEVRYGLKVDEKLGMPDNRIYSDWLEIPVRVWAPPTVNASPPPAAVPADASEIGQAGKVNWLGNKYVGLVGAPVKLQAAATLNPLNPLNNDDSSEQIDHFIWDFDNNSFDTIELEQPADQIGEYTWDTASLSGKIYCKAVTNFGVESEVQAFDLRIYDPVEVAPGGPYTGRPTQSVSLHATINVDSYPGGEVAYQWRLPLDSQGTPKNSAAQVDSGIIELTTNQNGINGQFEYTDLPLGDSWEVSGEFWTGGAQALTLFTSTCGQMIHRSMKMLTMTTIRLTSMSGIALLS